MVDGKLEVLLICAKKLGDTDLFNKMDPYAILTIRSQEQRSTTRGGSGSDPEWNESFIFMISGDASDLTIKLYDEDPLSRDDFVGEARISLEPAYVEGNIPPTEYRVVKHEEYKGEIKVALTFTPMEHHNHSSE